MPRDQAPQGLGPNPKVFGHLPQGHARLQESKGLQTLLLAQFSAGLELNAFLLGQPMNRGSGCPQAVGNIP